MEILYLCCNLTDLSHRSQAKTIRLDLPGSRLDYRWLLRRRDGHLFVRRLPLHWLSAFDKGFNLGVFLFVDSVPFWGYYAGLAFDSTGHHRPQSAFLFAHRPMFCFAGKRGQCKAIVCETASRELSKDAWFCVAWQ